MAETISCPHCQRLLQVPPDCQGTEVRCPLCGEPFVAPAQTNVTARPPQAEAPPTALEVRDNDFGVAAVPARPRRRETPDDDDDWHERVPSTRGFRPAGALGLAVKTLLALNLCVSLLLFGSEYLEYRLATRLIAGAAVPDAEILSNDARQLALGVLHFVTYLACAIVFVMWFYRAHANLEPLGTRHLTYTSGWAAGYWFIPILNLYRPVRSLRRSGEIAIPTACRSETFGSRPHGIPR